MFNKLMPAVLVLLILIGIVFLINANKNNGYLNTYFKDHIICVGFTLDNVKVKVTEAGIFITKKDGTKIFTNYPCIVVTPTKPIMEIQ